MKTEKQRNERRTDALSKKRIVEAAIEILDAEGEHALTFRALGARLSTGSGAIYWHIGDKKELLTEATYEIIAQAITGVVRHIEPRDGIRAIALGVFDAIDRHPWIGTQLSREPAQPAMLRIFEGIGSRLQALGVPEPALFNAASALLNYIVGVAGQNAANARLHPGETDRSDFLQTVAATWMQLDAAEYPFLQKVAAQLQEHDDQEQFMAGIDLILAGIEVIRSR